MKEKVVRGNRRYKMYVSSIGHYMLKTARQLIIDQKGIFMVAVMAFAAILPEPSPENVEWKGGIVLLRIRDKFLKYIIFKRGFYEAVWKIAIDEMVHDPDHRAAIQFALEELFEATINGEWPAREVGWPGPRMWSEPRTESEGNYGGFRGYTFKQYIKKPDKEGG